MREEAVQVLRTNMRSLQDTGREVLRWLVRTPGQTFVLCPIAVIAVELALHHGALIFVPWGCLLLVWGYLYHLVGRYRLPRAGGSWGMEVPPDQIVATGPYRYTRNPMYLGHLIFMLGLSLTFWSWFALILLATRAVWFHCRVLRDSSALRRDLARITRSTGGR
jgi:protein-S-isoprenylcysteine O-methyltransferase Ste14